MSWDFDGVDDKVWWASVADLTGDALTISVWVYWDGDNANQNNYIFNIGRVTDDNYAIDVSTWNNSGTPGALRFQRRGTTTLYRYTAGGVLPTGAWHHILVTSDGTFTDYTGSHIYFDGSEVTYTSSGNGATETTASGKWSIGGRYEDDARDTNGKIAEVGVWDRVLNSTEIGHLASGWRPDNVATPIFYFSGDSNTLVAETGGTGTAVQHAAYSSAHPTMTDYGTTSSSSSTTSSSSSSTSVSSSSSTTSSSSTSLPYQIDDIKLEWSSTSSSSSSSTSISSSSTSASSSSTSVTSSSSSLPYQVDDIVLQWSSTSSTSSSSSSYSSVSISYSTSSSTYTSSSTSCTSSSSTSSSSSISSSSSSSSSSTTSSSSSSVPPFTSDIAWGEIAPIETPVSWQEWDDGAMGVVTIIGNPDWGKLELVSGEEARSDVRDFGDASQCIFTIIDNKYGTGSGVAKIQVRGQATPFVQDAAFPAWHDYTTPFQASWRYVQVRVIKT